MSDPAPRTFWRWPDRRHFLQFLLLGLLVSLWFALVYGGADWLTAQHDHRVRVHFDADLALPFVPAAVVGYDALYPLFWIAPFALHTGRELRALAATFFAVILVAGVCFVLVPAEAAFPPTPDCGIWSGPVSFAKRLALTHNYVPSLHVAQAVVCVGVYALYVGAAGRALLWMWAAAIALSTLLLHQHYIIDVASGVVLGAAGVRWVYRRRMLAL